MCNYKYQSTGNGTGGLEWHKKSLGLVYKLFLPYWAPFCQENELPAKALLLDNAPGHPANLAEVRTPQDINVVYMPPNTASVLQPMDQGVMQPLKPITSTKPSWKWWEFWKGQTKLSSIGTHSTFWRALITSTQLGRKCQWTEWSVAQTYPRIYAQIHRIRASGEHSSRR